MFRKILGLIVIPSLVLAFSLACGGASSTPAPVISSFTPTTGTPGTLITVTGTGFGGATAVSICGIAISGTASGSTLTTTQITFDLPAVTTTGPVVVTNPSGTATSTELFDVAPSFGSLSINTGAVGNPVIIYGNGLLGVSTVMFNGIPAPILTTPTPTATQITVDVPFGLPASLDGVPDGVTIVLQNEYGITPYVTASFTLVS